MDEQPEVHEQDLIIENEWLLDDGPDDIDDSQFRAYTADNSVLSQISYHLTFNEDSLITVGSPGQFTEQID